MVIVFHTVLPFPDDALLHKVVKIAAECEAIVVMTHNSAEILMNDYGVAPQKIVVIAHEKIDHLIVNQQQDILEVHKVQIEMMNDILKRIGNG